MTIRLFSQTYPALKIVVRRALGTVAIVSLAACAQVTPPSVPSKPGHGVSHARAALQQCDPAAIKGSNGALAGSYVAGVLLGGILLGPIVVASNTQQIRSNGARRGVDRCLEEQGYTRRELTPREQQVLQSGDAYLRELVLDHLISGGSLDDLEGEIIFK